MSKDNLDLIKWHAKKAMDEIINNLHKRFEGLQIGDWVKVEYEDEIIVSKLINVVPSGLVIDSKYGDLIVQMKDIYIPTKEDIEIEKQYRWWKLRGRNIWGLKKNDIIKHRNYYRLYQVDSTDELFVYCRKAEKESNSNLIQIPLERIKEKFEVVYFKENREDSINM